MQIKFQWLYKNVGYFIVGLFFAGVLFDTISNAISLISPTITRWGTGLLLIFWIGMEFYVRKIGINWRLPGGQKTKVTRIKNQVRLFFSGLIFSLWIPFLWGNENNAQPDAKLLEVSTAFQPIFPPNDSANFNVLIIRFEDYLTETSPKCIGRSIEESLNAIEVNKPLSLLLKTEYADSISPPQNARIARGIQDRHNADLIIYGKAKNVQENCTGADICFRYNIADQVVAQVAPEIDVKATKYDNDYVPTNPVELEEGKFYVEVLPLAEWIIALINVKAGNEDEAFLMLDEIISDTTLSIPVRGRRFYEIGRTYFYLKRYRKGFIAFDNAIKFGVLLAAT